MNNRRKKRVLENEVVIGAGMQGKSYYVRKKHRKTRRVIVLDPTGFFLEDRAYQGFLGFDDLLRSVALFRPVEWRFAFCFRDFEDYHRALLLFEAVGGTKIIFDEAHLWAPATGFRWPVVERIVCFGRHAGIDWTFISQRALRNIHPTVRETQVHLVTTFKTICKSDLVYLADMGFDIDKVVKLKKFEFLQKKP